MWSDSSLHRLNSPEIGALISCVYWDARVHFCLRRHIHDAHTYFLQILGFCLLALSSCASPTRGVLDGVELALRLLRPTSTVVLGDMFMKSVCTSWVPSAVLWFSGG